MHNVCFLTKATDTHSECVIRVGFPLQRWLHKRAPMLRLYVHCLSCSSFWQSLQSCPGSNSVWPQPLPAVYYFQCIYSLIWPLDAVYLQSVIKWTSRDIEYDNQNWNWPFSTKSWNEFEAEGGSHAYFHIFSVSLSAVLFSIRCIVNKRDGSEWSLRARGVFNLRNVPLVYLATATKNTVGLD